MRLMLLLVVLAGCARPEPTQPESKLVLDDELDLMYFPEKVQRKKDIDKEIREKQELLEESKKHAKWKGEPNWEDYGKIYKDDMFDLAIEKQSIDQFLNQWRPYFRAKLEGRPPPEKR